MRSTIVMFALAGLVPVPVSASPGRDQPTLETVVSKHLEAMGGVARLKALKSINVSMTETFDGKTTTVNALRARPNLMRWEMTEGASVAIKAFDGTAGWFSKDGAVEAIAGEKLAGMKSKAAFDDALVDPSAVGAKLELAGKEDIAGAPAHVVKVSYANGTQETRYIDAKSSLEVKRSITWNYEGKTGTKTITFKDYRPVNGIMTSFARNVEHDGKLGTTTVTKVEYDAPVQMALFAMPKASASKPVPTAVK